jgi:signal transduction histidine kinase
MAGDPRLEVRRDPAHEEDGEWALHALEAMQEVAGALGARSDPRVVLQLIAERGRALASAASVLVLIEEGDELVAWAVAGEGSAGGRAPAGEAPRPESFGVRAPAALQVPLVFRGHAYGVLLACARTVDGADLGRREEELLHALAVSAAMTVHATQAVGPGQLRYALEAAERERQHWARELHDETLQGLGALRVLLSSGLRGRPAALREAAAQAVDEINRQIEAMRGLITELRPAALDELGLDAAIEVLVERAARDLRLRTEVDLAYERGESTTRLLPELEASIYRLVQEALTNVAKHSRARAVIVRILEAGGRVAVEVQDDGVGFDPAATPNGFGIIGMRERVALAGGTLEIASGPGSGTTVRASFPAVHAPPASPPLPSL